jgi:hypothetical protein
LPEGMAAARARNSLPQTMTQRTAFVDHRKNTS